MSSSSKNAWEIFISIGNMKRGFRNNNFYREIIILPYIYFILLDATKTIISSKVKYGLYV